MKINRLIYAICLIGSLVFVSFEGGALPYMLVWTMLLLPVISAAYTYILYKKITLYQEIPERSVVKNSRITYKLLFRNCASFSAVRIRLIYDESLSGLDNRELMKPFSLKPYERMEVESGLVCRVRGTYYVGIDKIEITDFLNLFSVKYSCPTKVRLTVKPAIVPLENGDVLKEEIDAKNYENSDNIDQNEYAAEVRKYESGDSIRKIHWKNTAKTGQLMVRKQELKQVQHITCIMMSKSVKGTEKEQLVIYDKIIERTLAVLNEYVKMGMQVSVLYYPSEKYTLKIITNYADLYEFLDQMAEYRFAGNFDIVTARKMCKNKYIEVGGEYYEE